MGLIKWQPHYPLTLWVPFSVADLPCRLQSWLKKKVKKVTAVTLAEGLPLGSRYPGQGGNLALPFPWAWPLGSVLGPMAAWQNTLEWWFQSTGMSSLPALEAEVPHQVLTGSRSPWCTQGRILVLLASLSIPWLQLHWSDLCLCHPPCVSGS